MFKKNEEKYGVTTTYSPEMEGYTTPLQKKNTKEWKEQEAKAQQIAHEIEHSPVTQTRAEIENGEDEEEKYVTYNFSIHIKLLYCKNNNVDCVCVFWVRVPFKHSVEHDCPNATITSTFENPTI